MDMRLIVISVLLASASVGFAQEVVECGEDESLLEMNFDFSGRWYIEPLSVDWRLKNENGKLVAGCPPPSYSEGDIADTWCDFGFEDIHQSRHCVPANGCYQLIVVDTLYLPGFDEDEDTASFNVTVDGKLLASQNGFRFESFEFGDACAASPCSQPDESLFEFFLMRRVFHEHDPDLTWQVMDANSNDVVLQDTVTWNETFLQYQRACLPTDTCYLFSISVPESLILYYNEERDRNVTLFELEEYRISFNGVDFYDNDYLFGEFRGKINFEDILAFGECQVANVCNVSAGEMLVDLQLETADISEDDPDFYRGGQWFIHHVDPDIFAERGFLPQDDWLPVPFAGYFADTSYRHYECIPTDECTALGVKEGDFSDFQVAVNGVMRTGGDRVCEGDSGCYTDVRLGGENCPTELSGGAIAGIVVGGIAAVVALGFVGYRIWKKKRAEATATAAAAVTAGAAAPTEPKVESATTTFADCQQEPPTQDKRGNTSMHDEETGDLVYSSRRVED